MTPRNSLSSHSPMLTSHDPPLQLRQTYANKDLLVIGGTGFLGKVWWSLLLHRLPEIGKLYLVVRPRPHVDSSERFWSEIAPHDCLAPLRRRHGTQYEAFLRSKLVPIDGDITQPYCGIGESLREELRGNIDAVVNASGIVNFQPPLDIALEVNAFGAQSVVDLAKDLGQVPIVHTSTCYVAGYRTGIVEETNPLTHPFPFAGRLERAHWDPDREIAECLDIIRQAKHRAGDAFRQSHFLDQAKKNLIERGEPSSGAVLEGEIELVRRRFVEVQLSQLGQERAQFWGWPNTYTYTKSIGEQIIARSGLPFTIVRPAIIESCVEYPCAGWNEGVNTSAPIIYAIRQGQTQLPGDAVRLDLIPCDYVASGMLLSLAELLEGRAKAVYQYGTSDSNPVTMSRVYELSGLYKRKFYLTSSRGSSAVRFMQAHVEGALLRPAAFDRYGPRRLAKSVRAVADFLERVPAAGPSLMLEPFAASLRQFARGQERVAAVVGQFVPFTAELDYEFRCDNTRSALARVSAEERELLCWEPEQLDWRDWFLNTHIPGLERHVFPELEAKLRKPVKPLRRYETLVHLLREMSERFEHAVALQQVQDAGLTRISFADWHSLALAYAHRLQAFGVGPGDTVVIGSSNQPSWAVALFGVWYTGAIAVPLAAEHAPSGVQEILTATNPKLIVLDAPTKERLDLVLGERAVLSLESAPEALEQPVDNTPAHAKVRPDMPALLLHPQTQGLASRPVLLTHEQLTTALSAVAPLFKLSCADRFLVVQSMHGWFELLCGLLLPLLRGARVIFPRTYTTVDVAYALKAARVTAIAGGPTVWAQLLEQASHVAPSDSLWHPLASAGRALAARSGQLGIAAAPLLRASQHEALGGHLRLLINGGGPIAPAVRLGLGALGLPLADVYGLAETGPVCVSSLRAQRGATYVGTAVPGIEIAIVEPDATGLGEIEVKQSVQSRPLRLRTGDLGRLDARQRLTVHGQVSDAVRTETGLWAHPTELEQRIGMLSCLTEWALEVTPGPTGAGRIGCVAVVPCALTKKGSTTSRSDASVRAELAARFDALDRAYRPAYTLVREQPLPRTSSGRVDRDALKRQLHAHRLWQASQLEPESADGVRVISAVRQAVREVLGLDGELDLQTSLRVDLPVDALSGLRIMESLERTLQQTLDHTQWLACDTLADVATWLKRSRNAHPDTSARLRPLHTATSPLQRITGRILQRLNTGAETPAPSHIGAIDASDALLLVTDSPQVLAHVGDVKTALGSRGELLVPLRPYDWRRKSKATWRPDRAPDVTYTGMRQLLERTHELLRLGRIPLVLMHNATYDGCQSGLGRLLLEANVNAMPVVAPTSAAEIQFGYCIEPSEVRELLTAAGGMQDLEKRAGELVQLLLALLSQGHKPSLSELVIPPQAYAQPTQGQTPCPAERPNQAGGPVQGLWGS